MTPHTKKRYCPLCRVEMIRLNKTQWICPVCEQKTTDDNKDHIDHDLAKKEGLR